MDYDDLKRPPSDNLVDIHVYLVPLEFWREQLNSAVNQIIEETVSMGFVRVYPDHSLQELRQVIATQLSDAPIPQEYTFLRSVGRCLTRVQAKQESQMKAKNYVPPQAYAPEIFILEGPPDNRSSVGHPFSRWSGDRSLQNSSDTVRATSRSEGPYKRLPAISNSRHNSPSEREHHPRIKHDAFNTDPEDYSSTQRGDSHRVYDNNEYQPKDETNPNEDRWEERQNEDMDNNGDVLEVENRDDPHRERTLPPLSASPTHIRPDEHDSRDDGLYTNGYPLNESQSNLREGSPNRRHPYSESPDRYGRLNEESQQKEEGLHSSYFDEDRFEQFDENQSHSFRDAVTNGEESETNYSKALLIHSSETNKRQFSSIEEENEEYGSQKGSNKENQRSRSPTNDSSNSHIRKRQSSDERKRNDGNEKERLMREMEEATRARQEVERKREELVKRAKLLQAQTQHRRNQVRDVWKKKYFEEKKKTPPLEEQVTRLRTELENLHHRIISQLEGSREEGTTVAPDRSVNLNNLKLQATKASHDITDLQRRVDTVQMKLTGEIKLRKQAELELKALKAELTQKKINLTLTRSQQLQSGNTSLYSSINGSSTVR